MRERFLNPPPVFIEISPASLRVLRESGGLELPLQRAADGKLTAACRKELICRVAEISGAEKLAAARARDLRHQRARGFAPADRVAGGGAGANSTRVLRLQIEEEFPLSPDELAWGWREISNGAATARNHRRRRPQGSHRGLRRRPVGGGR